MKLTNLDILNEDYWFLLYKTGWALIIIFSELPLMPHFLPAVFLQLHTCCQRKILFLLDQLFFQYLFFMLCLQRIMVLHFNLLHKYCILIGEYLAAIKLCIHLCKTGSKI